MIVVSFIAAAVLVGIDQLTKYLAVQYVKPAGSISVIDGFFQLTYVENRGAAFGMLQNQRWFFIGMTVVLILAACIPVSYTHLDVYKRQSLFFTKPRRRGFPSGS